MPSSDERQITVLPNLDVDEPIELRDFVLISSSEIGKWIPKTYRGNVRALASLFSTVDYDIQNVGLIVRKRTANRIGLLTEVEKERLSKVVDALSYSSHGRRRFNALMQDNFHFATWSFPATRAISPRVNIRNRRYGMHVVDRKDHMIQIPLYVHHQSATESSFDTELLNAVLICAYSDADEDNRIMRAINWVNQSRTDTDSVSDYTRFMMIATAFEALLDTPESNITRYFTKTIQFLLGSSEELEKWSKEFYQNRSRIVHGGALPELRYGVDKHSSMLNLADIVFKQCLIRKLGLMGYWQDLTAEQVRRENIRKYLVSNRERFATIRKFRLSFEVERATTVYNYLYTIQRGDFSATADECQTTLITLLDLALQGVNRLSRMTKFRNKDYKEQLTFYKAAFSRILDRVSSGDDPDSSREFMAIEPHPSDDWIDPEVRGIPFGSAEVLNLGAIKFAIQQIDDLYVLTRHS